jgi:uncharacterized protein (DUF1778 family)
LSNPASQYDQQVPRPATGKTPLRNIRMSNDLWNALKEAAEYEGKTVTDVLVAYARRYVAAVERKRQAG